MADRDQIALDAATKIMDLVYGQMPVGGSVQLKAGVQLIVADAIATQNPAVRVDVSDEMVERLVDDIPRQRELARRLIASGPKAAHVSCSETHEISEFVDDACDYIERVTAALRTGGGES